MTRKTFANAITAGGPVLRVYEAGCFSTTIEQETYTHAKRLKMLQHL